MTTPPAYQLFVGIDIAAKTFTATWAPPHGPHARPMTFPQTNEGFSALPQHLTQTGVAPASTLIVLEATSSYWVSLAVALHQAGYQVAVVNPAHIHNYVKSLPRRSKTDALDAHVLLHFAKERQPQPWTPPPQV
jgi:transposase